MKYFFVTWSKEEKPTPGGSVGVLAGGMSIEDAANKVVSFLGSNYSPDLTFFAYEITVGQFYRLRPKLPSQDPVKVLN